MPGRRPSSRRASTSAPARVLAAVGGVVAFLGIASLIEPSRVPAAFDWPRQTPSAPNGGTSSHATEPLRTESLLLVTLVGGDYTVEVYAGNPEPVFTVYDAAGNRVADRLPKSDVYRIDPALDIDSMMGSAMGLVEDSDL